MVTRGWQGLGRGSGGVVHALLAVVALCLGLVRGGALDARVEVDRDVVEAGESFVLNLVIRGTQGTGRPGNLAIPGLQLRYLGPMSQMESVNGQTTVQVVHRYMATPVGTNDVVVPGFTIQAGTETLTTQPVRVRVLPREARQEPVWVKVLVDRDTAVVGEAFPVEVQLYFQSVKDVSPPRLELDGFVLGRAAEPRQAATVRGDQSWSVVSWRFAATASKSGDLRVGPAEVDLTLLTAMQGRPGTVFDDFFGPPRSAKRMTVKSEGRPMRVSQPPAAGRPPGFAGVVGQFRMAASVSPSRVNAGDPVTVRVSVQGEGAIERMELPPWPETPSLRVYPGTNGFAPADALGLSGTRTLEYVVVPEVAGKIRLPVPSLVSFDPVSREYRTATAGDVVLDVLPGVASEAVGVGGGVGTHRMTAGDSPAKAWRAGVRAGGSGRWGGAAWVGWTATTPWLAWGAMALGREWRRRRALRPPPSERGRWLGRMERARSFVQAGTEDLGACGDVVRCWLAWWLDRDPATITQALAMGALREKGVDEETTSRLARWFEEWESRRFAPDGVGAGAEFRAETLSLVGRLEEVTREVGRGA